MWGFHAIGIAVPLYNRRPRQAFAEVKQLENRKPELTMNNIKAHKTPTTSIFATKGPVPIFWRVFRFMFAVAGIAMFAFVILALVFS